MLPRFGAARDLPYALPNVDYHLLANAAHWFQTVSDAREATMLDQADTQNRRRGWGRVWDGLKGLAIIVATVASAVAANSSRQAVCNVAATEKQQLEYSRRAFTHEVYRDYIKFRMRGAKQARPRLRCYDFLGKSDMSDRDLYVLLAYYPKFEFDEAKHAPLKEFCLDDEEKAEKWSEKQSQLVTDKISRDVTTLDAALAGYRHGAGNALMICENFVGFLQSGLKQEEFGYGYGILGRFLKQAIDTGNLRGDNYPNLLDFTKDVSELTGEFKRPIDCGEFQKRFERKRAEPAPDCDWALILWLKQPFQGWLS
jgi:hypothetical protein